MQRTQHDSPGMLVLWRRRSRRNSNGVTLRGNPTCRWGR